MNHALSCLSLFALTSTAFAQAPLYDTYGAESGDLHGYSLAPLGDINGDGAGDYAIGAPAGDGLQNGSGYVRAISGKDGFQLWRVDGEVTGDLFGWSGSDLGDIDGDGVTDVIFGAPRHEWVGGIDRGAVYVLSGKTGALIRKLGGTGDGDQLGTSVTGLGDVDGDGTPDYAFGVPYSDSFQVDGGVVWIFSGATHASLRLLTGSQAGARFGFALDRAGDVNGDGRADLLVGEPGYDTSAPPFTLLDTGRGHVISAIDGVTLHTETGSPVDFLGTSVAGGQDLNSDGRSDFAFGAPSDNPNGVDSGSVRVVSGAAPFPDLYTLDGPVTGGQFGAAVELVPDSDGDGGPDLMIGAPQSNFGVLSAAGLAYLYNGASQAFVLSIAGRSDFAKMGTCVASPGFINADGYADIFGGAPFQDHATLGVASGWGRFVLGGAPAPTPFCAAKVNSAGCLPYISYTGCASKSVGDFNVVAANVLEGKAGIMIWSRNPGSTPFFGGTLCLKAPIKRTPVQTSTTSGSVCGGSFNFDFTDAYMASNGVSAGDVIYMQYWSRDSGFATPNGIGLTNGLMVTVAP